jgi:hypothetical protein
MVLNPTGVVLVPVDLDRRRAASGDLDSRSEFSTKFSIRILDLLYCRSALCALINY